MNIPPGLNIHFVNCERAMDSFSYPTQVTVNKKSFAWTNKYKKGINNNNVVYIFNQLTQKSMSI